jgi:hypothetical protein
VTPTLRIGLTIDCPDPDQVASFWEEFIGYRRRPGGEGGPYVTIEKPDGLDAGASMIDVMEAGEWTTRVLLDPAGNEFCVIGPE